MKVSQLSFLQLSTPADRPYGSKELQSKYQHQTGPVPSQYYRNYPGGPAAPEQLSLD